jgi:hypothetical protein
MIWLFLLLVLASLVLMLFATYVMLRLMVFVAVAIFAFLAAHRSDVRPQAALDSH